MIDLSCPNCGRAGSIPREKVNTRLVCKKCHIVFHMNTAGRTLLGEPHVEPLKAEKRSHEGPHIPSLDQLGSLKDSLPVVSSKQLMIGLAALVVGGGIFLFVSRPGVTLADRTKELAQRFAQDDLAYLKEVATSDTADDAVRWFDRVHPVLMKNREQWKTKDADVQVMVAGEDARNRTGEAHAYLYPAKASTHSAKVQGQLVEVDPTNQPAAPPVDLHLFWIRDGSGKWRLDGRMTYQSVTTPN